MNIEYTPVEKALLEHFPDLQNIDNFDIERLANEIENVEDIWVAVELGRCPSTDVRTYILHTYYNKPEFDYYGAELINLNILNLNTKKG